MTLLRFNDRSRFRNPWMEFERIRRGLDELSQNAFDNELFKQGRPTVYPPLNILETPDSLIIKAELPGVTADQVDISIEGDTLTLQGNRESPQSGKPVSHHRQEIESGNFSRAVGLPVKIDVDSINAKLANGILTITMNKAAETKPRQVKITTE